MRIYIAVACLWLATPALQGKIAFQSKRDGGNYEIYTMNSDGSNQTRLTFNAGNDARPAWSPNGQQIAFSSTQDGNTDIYVMDADGKNQRRLTHHPAFDNRPSWSPDGSQIVFGSGRVSDPIDHTIEIFIMDADGNNQQQITHFEVIASKPKWSPNGEWILFQSGEIYAIRPDGSDLWQVSAPRIDTVMSLGDWSPDGKRVLYTEVVDFKVATSFPVIATLAPNGGEVIRWKHVKIPRMPVDAFAFSGDGESILFSGEKDDVWQIFRYRLIDKKLTQLTDSPGKDMAPQEWNPRLPVELQRLTPTHWGEIKTTK